ncbi:MAG: hypothetical protein ACR2PG_00720 [Hyphomicrobiaceae bacterium]
MAVVLLGKGVIRIKSSYGEIIRMAKPQALKPPLTDTGVCRYRNELADSSRRPSQGKRDHNLP